MTWNGQLSMRFLLVGALGILSTAPSAADRDGAGVAYHLRVVRVTGATAPRGAGLGCEKFCGAPIVLPSDEAWGTPEQLSAIARMLGGERADAVTGFVVGAGASGEARFEGTVYPGETSVRLRFTAKSPAQERDPHEIEFALEDSNGSAVPLAEAHVLVRAERTVAIAAPSPIEGEWIVLAATPMDPAIARERMEEADGIRQISLDPRMTLPKSVSRVEPVYPTTARDERRTGKVVLETVIDAEGIPRAVTVVNVSPGCQDMAAAAVEAVQSWRYEPATFDGRPTAVYFTIVVEFRLR